MRRNLQLYLALFLVIVLLVGSGCTASVDQADNSPSEYVVGVTLELTGPSSIWGIPQRDSLQLLAKKVNESGGINGVPLRLVIYDNASDGPTALMNVKKLVEDDKVLAIIGGGTTPTTLPLIPLVTQAKVPLVSIGASNAIIEPPAERTYVFKTPYRDTHQVAAILEYLKAHGTTRLALLTVNNAYGDSGRDAIIDAAPSYGVAIVAAEKFGASDQDATAQLTRIKAQEPDATIVWAIPPSASIAARGFHELAVPGILAISDVGSKDFVRLAGGAEAVECV